MSCRSAHHDAWRRGPLRHHATSDAHPSVVRTAGWRRQICNSFLPRQHPRCHTREKESTACRISDIRPLAQPHCNWPLCWTDSPSPLQRAGYTQDRTGLLRQLSYAPTLAVRSVHVTGRNRLFEDSTSVSRFEFLWKVPT